MSTPCLCPVLFGAEAAQADRSTGADARELMGMFEDRLGGAGLC